MTHFERERIIASKRVRPLTVALWEIGHFDVRVIHWAAVRKKWCKQEDWIAYHITGIQYKGGGPKLLVQIKVFTQSEMDSLEHFIGEEWDVTDYVGCN